MATKDIKSTFTVEAKGRGFDELIRRTQTLGQGLAEDKLTGGFKRLDHFTKQVERQFRGMERHLKSLNQVLHQVGKSADKMDQLAKSMEKVAKAAEKARGTGTGGAGGGGRQGAFTQGLVQGLGVGEFIPRGPGMGRQVAGRMLGSGIRRTGQVGAGLGSATFSGLGGLQSALEAIPGGGVAGGLLQAGMAAAQQSLAFQKQQVALAPALRGSLGIAEGAGAAAAARARARVLKEERFQARSYSQVYGETAAKTRENEVLRQRIESSGQVMRNQGRIGSMQPGDMFGDQLRAAGEEMTRGLEPGSLGSLDSPAVAARKRQLTEENIRRQQEGQRAAASAAGRARRQAREDAIYGPGFRSLGTSFGQALPQLTQTAVGLTRAAGGTLAQARQQGALGAGLGAEAAFGVDMGTTAGFLRGGRQGGLVGGRGRAGDAMAEAIGKAVTTGLEGSEIADFLSQQAQGIQAFAQTGIPINPGSVLQLGTVLQRTGGGAGLSAQRAAQLQKGFQGITGKFLGGGGLGAGEFQVLRSLGGFQGGGVEDFSAAMKRIQEGKFVEGGLDELLRTVSAGGGGGALGGMNIAALLQKFGAPITLREAEELQASGPGSAKAKDIESKIRARRSAGDSVSTAAGLQAAGAAVIPEAAKKEAAITNRRLDVGANLVTSMLNLEDATSKSLGVMKELAPQLNTVTGAISEMAGFLPQLVKAFKSVLSAGGTIGTVAPPAEAENGP
jgi:hypothetical protein